jgi:hypothetical protein
MSGFRAAFYDIEEDLEDDDIGNAKERDRLNREKILEDAKLDKHIAKTWAMAVKTAKGVKRPNENTQRKTRVRNK